MMLESDVKNLKERGDRLFAKKRALDTIHQEIADNFYVERADFTSTRSLGDSYADHLMTSYPVLVRRQLGDAVGSMLRPKGKQWFNMSVSHLMDNVAHQDKLWMERATILQRRATYNRRSNFTRATKEGDHDFSSFGNCVISVEMNRRHNTLLYRNWHLRDVCWEEDSYGEICSVHRNWKPTASEVVRYFSTNVHPNMQKKAEKNPHEEVNVRHIMIYSDLVTGQTNLPWFSVFIDLENDHLLLKQGSRTRRYVIPRWVTVSGSQYGYSPATMVALPDARLLQAMTLTLLDAGEIAVRPPMIGVAEAIRGDMQLFSGGFTSVDAEYDERLGEVLRPINNDKSGLPLGFDMNDRLEQRLREIFFLNTLSMPPQTSAEMTAFEVGERVNDYIRQALPLFEPMEGNYNGEICDMTFETLLYEGGFGPFEEVPPAIMNEKPSWEFESPLSQSLERNKGQKFLEAKALIADAVSVDPSAVNTMDFGTALRDALQGIGAPLRWQTDPEEAKAQNQQNQEMVQAQQLLDSMNTGADVVEKLSGASNNLAPPEGAVM